MSTVDLCLNQICTQRRQRLKFTVPPIRYNPVSPYVQFPQYTKYDFDMRRKAEILKYDKSNTKTNKLTKNQKWTQLVNGTIPQSNPHPDTILYQRDVNNNYTQIIVKYPDTYRTEREFIGYDSSNHAMYTILGDGDNGLPIYLTKYVIIPGQLPLPCDEGFSTPSVASDVPGSSVNLYLDKNVPLYNYSKNTGNYAIINQPAVSMWNTFTTDDIVFSDSINNKLFDLLIQNTIKDYAYNFAFQTPISIFYNGEIDNNVVTQYGNINLPNNSIRIQNISVVVYYNGEKVTLQKQPNISSNVFDASFQFDISMNYNSSNKSISGNKYLGLLTVSNLYLLTQPGYVYDIQLNFTILPSLNISYLSNFKPISTGVICNVPTFPKTSFVFSGQ